MKIRPNPKAVRSLNKLTFRNYLDFRFMVNTAKLGSVGRVPSTYTMTSPEWQPNNGQTSIQRLRPLRLIVLQAQKYAVKHMTLPEKC